MTPADAAPFLIRPLQRDDRSAWQPLWRDYLAFYEADLPPEVTETTWQRLNDPAEPVHGLVAERDGTFLGVVHFIYHCSTWSIGPYCYLQDLFTVATSRGQGVGKALIEAVHERARAAGASRVYWLTQGTNRPARALYDKVATRTGFIQYRRPI